MKPKYTKEEFDNAKSMDKLPCQCYHCESVFYTYKKLIKHELNNNKGEVKFCSRKCYRDNLKRKTKIQCTNCDNIIELKPSEIQRSKSKRFFCSHSCNASYNNKNKTYGTRRSKLEQWIEEQLTILYPKLEIHFNQKSAIGSELDIYIPSLNLAFELNGIFHYEPIYGVDKLQKIQDNDVSKSKACHDAKIDLCIIDTSAQKYVKESTSQKYLDIITKIINERTLTS